MKTEVVLCVLLTKTAGVRSYNFCVLIANLVVKRVEILPLKLGPKKEKGSKMYD